MKSFEKPKNPDVRSETDVDDVEPEMGGVTDVSAKDGEQKVSEMDGDKKKESEKDEGPSRRGKAPLRRERSRSRSESRKGTDEVKGHSGRSGRNSRTGSCVSRETSVESNHALFEDTYEMEMGTGSDTSSRSLRVVLERLPKTYGKLVTETSRLERKRTMSESSNDDSHPQTKVSTTSRGRGRPPTTGQYVGLAKAKQALLDLEQEELRLQAEKEVAEMAKEHRARSRSLSLTPASVSNLDDDTAATLREQVQKSVELILHVAQKSGNLKGTFVRGLKDAASSISGAVSKLSLRTATEENARLEAQNAKLKAELESFRKQLEEIRQEQVNLRLSSREAEKLPEQPATKSSISEEDMRRIMIEVGTMFNARFAACEECHPPAQRVRPPLAIDRTPSVPSTSQQDGLKQKPKTVKSRGENKSTPKENSKRRKKKGKKTPCGENGPSTTSAGPPREETAVPKPAESEWVTVVKRGKKKEAEASKTAAKPANKQEKIKLRTPRTTAVVLTIQPEGEKKGLSYADILTKAKTEIDLTSLGISAGLKIRTAATGAKILEIPGATSSAQADSLAGKLKQTFGETEVRVTRPVKCCELRITDLDDSTTEEEVIGAIAKETGCPLDAIKVGTIRRSTKGLGTLWVRCPIAEAKALDTKGRLLVGWVSARVTMLQPRPQRCYRCHDGGHVQCKCTSAVDRSGLCYRCGKEGHKAASCNAAPCCSLCSAAGKPAGHIVGSKACPMPRTKKTPPKSVGVPASEAMDEVIEVAVSDRASGRKKGGEA